MIKQKTLYIGTVLKRIRRQKGLSQEEVAFRSSINRTYISMLERDIKRPSLGTIFALAAALEIKPSEFIKEIEEHHEKNHISWRVTYKKPVKI